MRAVRSGFIAVVVFAGLLGAAPARAQATFEFVGKVADREGKPVAGVKLQIVNQAITASVRDGVSDKRGSFWIAGVPYSQQHRMFTISIQSPDTAIWKVKVVGRAGDRTIYDEFEKDLNGTTRQFDMRVLGAGELRAEFVVGPPAEVAPAPVQPGTAPESADPLAVAQQKARAGDYEGAAAILQEAVAATPDDAERREWFASVLLRLGRAGEAQAQAMKAVQSAPDRVGARIVLADAQYQIGQIDRARETLAEARKVAPTDPTVARRHAVIAAESGKPADAIESWRVVVAAKPEDAEAWMSLGDLYAQTGDAAKSEAAYKKVVELDPEHAYRTYFNLGAVIENRDNLSEADNRKAADAFRKAIEIKPDYALAYRHLGYTLLRSGDLPGAKKAFQKYLELEPKAADAGEIRATVKSLP